jgi:glycosyltransferase involved in cell wall biosynthesis
VTVLALAAPGLPATEQLEERIRLVRLDVDRTIAAGFRPLPRGARRWLAESIGLDEATSVLPPAAPRGLDRLRAPLRRLAEIAAHVRRVEPWTRAVLAAAPGVDVYQAKALIALPVVRAAAARTGARFVYDIADIHTEAARLARMPAFVRATIRSRERGWLRDAAALIAASDGIADEAVRRFDVRRPAVVLNCPPRWRPEEPRPPTSDRLRSAIDVDERPVILFQGGFSIDRAIEELVASLDEPPLERLGAAVVLLGYGRLRDELVEAARRRPGRLFVLDAVPPGELLEWTASADVMFVGQPPRTLNQRLNLANKLFEALMVGVPAIVAAGTEHCRLVQHEGVGRCCDVDSPREIARAAAELLGAASDERDDMRVRCRSLALDRYNWETQQQTLLEVYRGLAAA